VTSVPRKRAKPGSRGGGRFFHIELRPASEFGTFRVQDVGERGGVERVAGRRASGGWDTAKWLVEKTHAHIEGDRFKAKPRRDIPESEKPTAAMRRAQLANIRKAQAARRPM
jgi:hypothetical protein